MFSVYTKMSYAEYNSKRLQLISTEFAEALKYADANMWDEAGIRVDALNNSVAFDTLQWLKLRAGGKTFSEYESFLLINDDWPGIALLRSRGEMLIDETVQLDRIRNYFSHYKPRTAHGALIFAQALLQNKEIEHAREVIKHSWLDHSYTANELEKTLTLFGPFLESYNIERLDNLLWLGKVRQAKKMLPVVPHSIKQLSKVRIALKEKSSGLDFLISELPRNYKNHAGLLFDRFSYRQKKNLHKGAEQILLETSTDAIALGKPHFWTKGRLVYARRALLNGEPEKAYKIVSNHFINFSDHNTQTDAVELEWLAGFIAFEFFQEYQTALKHFQKFFEHVTNPINRSKASYWIGRSYEKLLDDDKMMAAFEYGANYQTTFYGQLSAERIKVPIDAAIIVGSTRYEWEGEHFMNDAKVKSGILLYFSGRAVLADRFFNHASETMSRTERLKLSQLAHDLGLRASGVSIAKTAGQVGIFCPEFAFPIFKENFSIESNLKALVTAIVRQESGFFYKTRSSAGAIGPMQVMPRTASSMAKKLGLSFSKEKLLQDAHYNIKIGTYFLKTLLKRFNGSQVLSLAAYNAGPYRVNEWIAQFGDPRVQGIDPLIWIETIPFSETRNYVKRVMAADWVYRGKLNGKPVPLDMGKMKFGHQFK